MALYQKPFWLAVATLITPSLAQFGGFGGFGAGDGNNGLGGSSGFGHAGFGDDISTWTKQRMIHGILASIAFVILLPLGSIAMATVKGRWAFWVHSLVQMVGWVLFIAAAVLGFRMLGQVRVLRNEGGNTWIHDAHLRYHPILGIIILVLLLVQPVLGWIHHRQFKIHQRRTVVSYLHLLNGRLLIILGIVNGGLGLKVSRASDMVKLAYTIVAAILGGAWLVITVLSEVRKSKGKDIWGTGRPRNNGKSVRMGRIDKAVRAEAESERDSYGGADRRYA
ncbi:hypothetical protein N0V93_003158 [Gnomoniopsis smithogilvyi]|uniref:Cytochrome b561 domain-containing protein n=1 Tax=Gnomoniopsis smithogilvyi TaxID=1191159 RepID=A0A9W9CYV6_9PEZI|nr:hypothetical protein N0V93_003158 [Gnomoniopsis smithogilvyi]